MEKPDLDRLWETFIKIPTQNNTIVLSDVYDVIRSKIYPMISSLKEDGMIDWHCFLIHNRHSGVPTLEGDDEPYFHLRFEPLRKKNPKDFLPAYCIMTRKIKRESVESITGLNKSILKDGQIDKAWQIIGEQSEWIMKMLSIHKEDVEVPPEQVGQFLHYFANMTCVSVR